MMALHGKMYYLAPVYPMLFAAGAVWTEGATEAQAVGVGEAGAGGGDCRDWRRLRSHRYCRF